MNKETVMAHSIAIRIHSLCRCCDRGTGTKAKVITVDKTRVCGPSVGGETSSDTALDNQYMFDKLSVSSNRIKSVELEAQ